MVLLGIEFRPFMTGEFVSKGGSFCMGETEGLFPFCVEGLGRLRFNPNPTGDTAADCEDEAAPPANA